MEDSLLVTADGPITSSRRTIRRVALACIQCRARKVKCDAHQPNCHRCLADDKSCEYQKSRRGGRPRRPAPASAKQAVSSEATTLSAESTTQWNEVLGQEPQLHSSGSDQSFGSRSTGSSTHSGSDSPSNPGSITTGPLQLARTQIDQLLSQYYTYFHTAHPCVLPKWALQFHLANDSSAAETLLPVLLHIGSVFTHSIDSAALDTVAQRSIKLVRRTPGILLPFQIQALVLYAISAYWNWGREQGREILNAAIQAALDAGMHKAEYATQHGQGDPVLEECWRRTWWTIYVTDAHIAGSTHTFPTRTGAIKITTDLPCEEHQYKSGIIPAPASLRSYNVREFTDVEFSSFAQLIGFTRGVNQVLATDRTGGIAEAKDLAERADTMMTAWCSLLPPSKRRILRDSDGSVDELLFKANILMHTYIVDIHRQLSTLRFFPIESISNCIPTPPPETNDSITEDAHLHTAKVLYSVNKLNSLLTLPTRFSEHTPFIICMITLITIAHLSACRYIFKEPKLSQEREKIRLNMGVLKMLGEFWSAGQREYHNMGVIAREILGLQDEEVSMPHPAPIMPVDALDFNFDFDMQWACDSFANIDQVVFPSPAITA